MTRFMDQDGTVIRLVPPPPGEDDRYTMTVTFDVDLGMEFDSYMDWARVDPNNKRRRPFLDEVSQVAQSIVSTLLADRSIDANGIALALQAGRVTLHDTQLEVECDPRTKEQF